MTVLRIPFSLTTSTSSSKIHCIDGSKGALGTRAPSNVFFYLFSCSFRQESCQITGFCPEVSGPPPLVSEILDPPLQWLKIRL